MSTSSFQSIKNAVSDAQERLKKTAGIGEDDLKHKLRDRLLEASHPKQKAEELAEKNPDFEYYTDIVELLMNQGKKELEAAEASEEELEMATKEFKEHFNQFMKKEEEAGGGLNDLRRALVNAEKQVEIIEEEEKKAVFRELEDSEKFFQAVMRIAEDDPEQRVGHRKTEGYISEVEKMEERVRNMVEKLDEADRMLDQKRKEIKEIDGSSRFDSLDQEEKFVKEQAQQILQVFNS